jgi:hypothetical protein
MTALGLTSWVLAGFFVFGGASVALWIDRWLRQIIDARQAADHSFAIFVRGEHWDDIMYRDGGNIAKWSRRRSGSDVYVMLTFERPVKDGHITVFTTQKDDMKWMECSLSDGHAVVLINDWALRSKFYVSISAASASGDARRQQPFIWQKAIFLHTFDIFTEGHAQDHSWWRLFTFRSK